LKNTIAIDTSFNAATKSRQISPVIRMISRRFINILLTLLIIGFLTLFGLIMAERGRARIPAQPLNAAGEAVVRLGQFIFQHPATYFWNKETYPAWRLVVDTLGNSVALILLSMLLAILIGVPLGILLALSRRKAASTVMLSLSILGISTPSFLLGMFFWVINIQIHNHFQVKVLPSAGFGWDGHLVMPVLVLAMRPLAQIAQVTYVTLSDVLKQDFLRTARAKGLPWHLIRDRHALRNTLIPILNTLGTSLRFSLASLPVVEFFFNWPGVGLTLLEAINEGNAPLITDLILSLGLFFLLVNILLEMLFPLLDPRIREQRYIEEHSDHETLGERIHAMFEELASGWHTLANRLKGKNRKPSGLPPLVVSEDRIARTDPEEIQQTTSKKWLARIVFGNPSLIIGFVLVTGLFGLVLFGDRLTSASPYETHGVTSINGKIGTPPFAPSSVFPWGTDQVGRDIQSLVLYGARQTITLAFFGMLARILIGTVLGALAGWRQDGWTDRLVIGAVGVWAAFPITLFAMILIQALGIQQGFGIFVIGISVVGWGEAAQFVRAQVIGLKPQLFIEAARSEGARSDQILVRHVVPNLVAPILVLAVMEMGGVLMLLADLGFLNIFLGGGFRVQIAEVGAMQPVIAYFSDVPEWGALLANIRNWWRSYPWMAWYAGAAFFLTIMAFNLLGEGLRRFLDESRVNVNRIFNRFTFGASVMIIAAMVFVVQSNTPLSLYRSEALKFDAQRAMDTIQILSSPELKGRETGTPGAQFSALYIAKQMESIGLFPAGDNDSFIQALVKPRLHLTQTPALELLDDRGQSSSKFVYRKDYVEFASPTSTYGEAQASVVGLALGPDPGLNTSDPYQLAKLDIRDKIVLIREEDYGKKIPTVAGILILSDDPQNYARKLLYNGEGFYRSGRPVMFITSQVARQILAPSQITPSEFFKQASNLSPGEAAVSKPGASVHMTILPYVKDDYNENYYNVMGYIPGADALGHLDSQVVMVSAYYDGLGMGPDRTIYPGANDNASGVAAMLEIARIMMESKYRPDKTIMFVAWAGGERGESLSTTNIMNARANFSELNVEDVFELSGMGAGSGAGIALGDGSSFRLVQLFQSAAGRFNIATTTRGRGPHFGMMTLPAFAGRSALSLYVSWDGSDETVHTTLDTPQTIDLQKLERSGRATLLTLFVVSRETNY
jgi:ABC-type dipeptide/oligopeptide/nickel transport system permease component